MNCGPGLVCTSWGQLPITLVVFDVMKEFWHHSCLGGRFKYYGSRESSPQFWYPFFCDSLVYFQIFLCLWLDSDEFSIVSHRI